MAQDSPSSVDVQDIQFKLHDKWDVFSAGNQLRSNVNLLAVASSQGLLLVGNPCSAEFKVMMLKDVVECKTTGRKLTARLVQLPSCPNSMAVSCDGSMLAVNYTLNGSGFMQIYEVASFLSPNIKLLYNIRLSPEEDVSALQIIWNPVIPNNLAVVLNNGALSMFTLKESNNYDFHSLNKELQVRCGCWSPKGKQIVLGFGEGKLQQYKPDLTPAKTITCPSGVHPGPFDTIAVHWLSTFQFVVAFLQRGPEQSPSLYIINAPKGAAAAYINYYDICYSSTGPRLHQINFTYIQQWNLLLATSANGIEVGILGTKESGDTPTWQQYTLLDEARIEMPLTEEKEETYPIGFSFDISVSHQLTIAEKKLPAMPMVHVLSTHGHLVSFNFLNLSAGAADVCSPSRPVVDSSGQFKPLENLIQPKKTDSDDSTLKPQIIAPSAEMSFSFNPNAVTSTPAKEKTNPIFGNAAPTANETMFTQGVNSTFSLSQPPTTQPPSFGGFNLASASKSQFATTANAPTTNMFAGFGNSNSNTFGGLGALAKAAEQTKPIPASQTVPQQSGDLNKPLYTVPATFIPPTVEQQQQQQQKPIQQQQQQQQKSATKTQINNNEIDDIVKQMIAVQINSFNMELEQLGQHSQGLLANIGKPEEMKSYTKRLHDLQEIVEQANDRDFEMDMQHLRHSLMESFAMLAECRTKLDMYNNPEITRLTSISTFDPINRRQLAKLQQSVAANQAQMQQLQQQIDAQWASYQDLVRRNSKTKMHIPCLDGIYQRMTKLKDMITRQRTKLNCIKGKLKQKGLIMYSLNELDVKSLEKPEGTMESLADSILSMSLTHVVDASQSKLSKEKVDAIRNFVRDRQICHIKPHRPDRVGLKSEVILETKLRAERQSREGAVTSLSKMQQEKIPNQSNSAVMSKPTATKPSTSSMGQSMTSIVPPTSINSASTFGIGGTSPFVKTVPTTLAAATKTSVDKSEMYQKPFVASSAANTGFIGFNAASVATAANSAPKFGQTKNVTANKMEPASTAIAQTPPQVPISFAAKVVSSEIAGKPSASTFSFSKPTPTQDKENKKLVETEIPKTFSFGGDSTNLFIGTDIKPTFGISSANTINVAPFSGLNTSKASPFDGKPGTGFNFGAVGATVGSAPISNITTTSNTTSSLTKPFNLSFSTVGDSKITTVPEESKNSTPKATTSVVFNEATTVASAKEPIFKGQGKSIGCEAPTTTSSNTVISTGFNFSAALNLSAPKTEPTTATVAPTTNLSTQATSSSGNAAESLFGSLSICKPTIKDAGEKHSENVFGNSSFSFTGATSSGDVSKSFFGGSGAGGSFTFGSTATPATTTSTATTTPVPTTPSAVVTPTVKAAVVSTASTGPFTLTGISASSIATSKTPATTLNDKVTPIPTTTTITPAATSTSVTSSIFGQPAVLSSAAPSIFGTSAVTASTAATFPTTITSTPSLFGGSTANFATSTSATTSSSTSLFGASNTTSLAATSTSSLFGGAAAAGAATTSAPNSIFDSTTVATTTSGNLFGGIPKPDQSVFGNATAASQQSSGMGLFAAAAAANPSPFTSPNTGTGGSIFGGGSSGGFGAAASPTPTAGGSIFGGGSTNATSSFGANAPTGGSIFGGVAKPVEGGNIFGSATQPAAGGIGGSIFGQSTFGQSAATVQGGSLFGGGAQQQSTGFGGSIFGGGSASTASGGSIFGGASAGSMFGQSTGGFGAFSQTTTTPTFGSSNSAAGGGSFAQGGSSVAQSGFGSPQQSSSFAQPIFGGTPTFGSPPTFGAQPSFGGAATFGSPKGFGSFATPAVAAAPASAASGFTVQTQKNSLFEALGSTDSGLSFGNLAQNTNVNAPKPTFGGSSFMNYRA